MTDAAVNRLTAMYFQGVAQYNDEISRGGEPEFPQWLFDLKAMLDFVKGARNANAIH